MHMLISARPRLGALLKASALSLAFVCALPVQAQEEGAYSTEARQLDRALEKTRMLHARPQISPEAVLLELTKRINAQEGTRYTSSQVVEMLEITPAQMEMLQRGVGFDQLSIHRAPAFERVEPSSGAKAPPATEGRGGLNLNKQAAS